jgi:hypothetical protein
VQWETGRTILVIKKRGLLVAMPRFLKEALPLKIILDLLGRAFQHFARELHSQYIYKIDIILINLVLSGLCLQVKEAFTRLLQNTNNNHLIKLLELNNWRCSVEKPLFMPMLKNTDCAVLQAGKVVKPI